MSKRILSLCCDQPFFAFWRLAMKLLVELVLVLVLFSSSTFAASVSMTGPATEEGNNLLLGNMQVCFSISDCNTFFSNGAVIEIEGSGATYGGLLVSEGWDRGFLNPSLSQGTLSVSGELWEINIPIMYVSEKESQGWFTGIYNGGGLRGNWSPTNTNIDEPPTFVMFVFGGVLLFLKKRRIWNKRGHGSPQKFA